jgi:hypothetical protein
MPHTAVDDGYGYCTLCPLPIRHPSHLREQAAPRTPRDPGSLPIVRGDDPANSHLAAQRIQPSRDSARGRVLAYLQGRAGQWVDAIELTLPDVGGFGGTRRMRELREGGWPIETREKPGAPNVWQHRLPEDP